MKCMLTICRSFRLVVNFYCGLFAGWQEQHGWQQKWTVKQLRKKISKWQTPSTCHQLLKAESSFLSDFFLTTFFLLAYILKVVQKRKIIFTHCIMYQLYKYYLKNKKSSKNYIFWISAGYPPADILISAVPTPWLSPYLFFPFPHRENKLRYLTYDRVWPKANKRSYLFMGHR